MDLIAIIALVGTVIGIIVGIVQIIEYLKNLKEDKSTENKKNALKNNEPTTVIDQIERDKILKSYHQKREEEAIQSYTAMQVDRERKEHEAKLQELEATINHILHGVEKNNRVEEFEAWQRFLRRNLVFPFWGECLELNHHQLRPNELIHVRRITAIDDLDGVIAQVRQEDNIFELPLHCIIVVDRKTSNHKLMSTYNTWYKALKNDIR